MIAATIAPREPGEPAWFSSVGLQAISTSEPTVHLGYRGNASLYRGDGLVVLAESRTHRDGAPRGDDVDAVAVAEAYSRFGQDCVRRLPGRFRLILHDAVARKLFAASSTAPPWPLVYWSDSRTTVVASRLLPLLKFPDAPRTLDESYLVHLIMGLSAMPAGSTAFRGIRRLCPGEALVVDSAEVQVSRVDALSPRDVVGNRTELGESFVEELALAVARSSRQGPSAISFSGGLDSAALVAAGLRHGGELAAFSFVAPSLDRTAETDAIKAMERAWPRLHVTHLDASSAAELPDLGSEDHAHAHDRWRDDPPLTPLALLPARMLLWSRARDAGFQTVIEGEGGDELFSMLPTPMDALRQGHFIDAARHVLGGSGRRDLVEQGLWLPFLPPAMRRAWIARRGPVEAHLPAFAVWGAADRPSVREAVAQYLEDLVHKPFDKRLHDWLSSPVVTGAMLSRRHIAAGVGLELSWPMLDRGVLELVLGLHAAGAIHGAPTKPFLKDALAGSVPDEVRLRPKDVGLYKAFVPRVLTSPRARQALRDPNVKRRLADLVRFERIEAMLDGLEAGRSLGLAALWQLECVVAFADWYARASREYGVD